MWTAILKKAQRLKFHFQKNKNNGLNAVVYRLH
ncbi:hypothetical protein BST_1654 [Bacillus stercoris]